MQEQFLRVQMLLGDAALARLQSSHVCILGIGGVGSWCAEALARSGVGELTLMDHDEVGLTNINRQSEALHSTLGQTKSQAMANRILDINPDCIVHPVHSQYTPDTREDFFAPNYDYIVDAIDLVSCKLDLIETALHRAVPIISAMGTGNKLDPTRLQVSDISKTQGCPLARIIRKELRNRGIAHHKVVWSSEEAQPTQQLETPPPGRRSVPASAMWVPASAGLLLASEVVKDLTPL